MARSMQQDSTAVKTLSVLRLVFLPGTYVSVSDTPALQNAQGMLRSQALFGMSFFSFVPDRSAQAGSWAVSSSFWVYWVVTIPVKLGSEVMWHLWQRRSLSGQPASS